MKKLFMGLCVLALAVLACSINTQLTPSSHSQSAVASVVAQTMQAFIASQTANPPVMNSPVVAFTPVATPTQAKPILTINKDTNCRSAPSADAGVVTAFTPGTALDIVGKDTADNFWLVTIPKTTDTCWASGQYATPSGSYTNLPELTPTPAAASGVPARPGSLYYKWNGPCSSLTTILTWTDNSNNETGFHVYRDGKLIATLPANSNTYTDIANIPVGATITLSIEAYNAVGASPQRSISYACQ